jgi:vacuolar-type H+-ATPase subunit I/STV1
MDAPYTSNNNRISSFSDYCDNINSEKEELKGMRRKTISNSEIQQHVGNRKLKFNRITRKMDDLSPAEINDQIEEIEKLEEKFHGGKRVKKAKDDKLDLQEVRKGKRKELMNELVEISKEITKLERKKDEITKTIHRIEDQIESNKSK